MDPFTITFVGCSMGAEIAKLTGSYTLRPA